MVFRAIDSLDAITDGFPLFFVIPAVLVGVVGLLLIVGIVVFFARLSKSATDRTPVIRSMATEAADSSRRRRAALRQQQLVASDS